MYSNDEELGFVGAAVKAASGVGKVLGKIGKKIFKRKKKKKKKRGIIQMPATDIVGQVPSDAISSAVVSKAQNLIRKSARGKTDPQEIVRAVVAAVPGPVREVVLDALKSQSQAGAAKEQTMNALAGQIDEALKPKIVAMLAALQADQLSKQATLEHESLVKRAKFEDFMSGGLKVALDKLETIQARLDRSAIIPPSKLRVYGSRNVLE